MRVVLTVKILLISGVSTRSMAHLNVSIGSLIRRVWVYTRTDVSRLVGPTRFLRPRFVVPEENDTVSSDWQISRKRGLSSNRFRSMNVGVTEIRFCRRGGVVIDQAESAARLISR